MAKRSSEPGPKETPGGMSMELVQLTSSPNFPRRSPASNPSPPTTTTSTSLPSPGPASSPPVFHFSRQVSQSSEATDVTGSAVTTKSENSEEQLSKPKRRLQFKGEVLNLVTRRRNASSSSTGSLEDGRVSPLKSPSSNSPHSRSTGSFSPTSFAKGLRPGTPSKSPKPPKRQGTPDMRYVIAAKDASVLERLSQRVRKRAARVRKPHEVFVEMEELRADSAEDLEWEETARWIKFEEDVEEGTGRWGRPHISALAFHSLVDLRKGLDQGCILLDVEGDDFPTIAQEIVGYLVRSGQLPVESIEPVLRILLKKHKHNIEITLWEKLQHSARDGTLHHIGQGLKRITSTSHTTLHEMGVDQDGNRNGKGMTSNHSSSSFLRSRNHHNHTDIDKRISISPLLESGMEDPESPTPQKHVAFNISGSEEYLSTKTSNPTTHTKKDETSIEIEKLNSTSSADTKEESGTAKENGAHLERRQSQQGHPSRRVLQLMEKIPEEAESLTVLVGGVKFLEQPVVAFVRLAQSHLLGDLTEVPLPVRFIYLLLGPDDGVLDYHEIGRAMATLMSDKHFHEVAYSAVTEDELTYAIDEFLDDSIVLPPGDWDQDLLLPIMHERNEKRRRKEHKLQEDANRALFAVDALQHTRRPFGGMWHDVKNLVRRYPSDFRDALHIQVFISIIFLFISFLAPAIAFGGIMEEVTNNHIGETETLVATGMCGIVYGLFAVQPLSILAFTGPLLLMEEIVYDFSRDYNLPYLEWRATIGLWLMVILIIFAISESSFLVTYFSRFSEEVFTGIVVCFFIYEASKNILDVYTRNPLCGINYPCGPVATNTCLPLGNDSNDTNTSFLDPMGNMIFNMANVTGDVMFDSTGIPMMENMMENNTEPMLPRGFRVCNQPNTALWSTTLALGTFIIAVLLRKLRQGKFLGKTGRRLVSDFGMFVALTTMVLVAYLMRDLITVETLVVTQWTPSDPTVRGWFINPFGGRVSVGAGFGALLPALLVGILIFIENQLTVILVNKAEHCLKKGAGYHFDLMIVGILAGLCGLFGMPWFCAASVRSIQHVQALSVFSRRNAPGEKPRLLRVYEQRVTNTVVHLLIVLSPFAASILKFIPVSVVLGVFFYLAYASINGVQLRTRIKLLFMPPKHHPDLHYVRMARTLKMHLYTVIQVFLIAGLFALKLSPGAMIYPVTIVFLVPVRKFLGRFIFTHTEIEALDCEEDFPEDNHEEGEGEFAEYEETNVPY